jgi:tetratricopeptide (TPR) repeat protein
VNTQGVPQILPAIMGALRQEGAEGELVLEQNDGCRRIYFSGGGVVYLKSDVAGEQFGNYLLRQGIVDFPTLNELLASAESGRLGEKVIQWGLMSVKERDAYLAALQEQIMIHAVEHKVLQAEWNPGPIHMKLSDDLQFRVNHRLFVWNTFREIRELGDICDLLYAEDQWRWTAPANLLEIMQDLPLDPQSAFALAFFGVEPIGFQTLLGITNLHEEDLASLIVTLWALGALTLTQGEIPKIQWAEEPSPEEPPRYEPPVYSNPLPEEAPPPEPPAPEPEPVDPGWNPEGPPIALATEAPPPDDNAESLEKAKRLFLKARHFIAQERTAEAVRLLEQSVQLNPDDDSAFEAWVLLGKLRTGNPAWSTRAIEALQAASRLRPKAAEPWALMGDLYNRKGFTANAKACFKKALDLDPSVPIPTEVDQAPPDVAPPLPEPKDGLLGRFKSFLSGGGKA